MAQMHGGGGSVSEEEQGSSTQELSEFQMQGGGGMNQGLIGNNILGSPATLPAGGLAVIVVTSAIALAAAAFIVSWNHRSFLVAGLLAASGIILMILPLANMNFVIPGPIIGVITGLVILMLGAIKAVRTATAITVAPS